MKKKTYTLRVKGADNNWRSSMPETSFKEFAAKYAEWIDSHPDTQFIVLIETREDVI